MVKLFHSGRTSPTSNCTKISISLYPHQHLLVSVILITAILVDVTWCPTVVLICVFLMISDAEHLFMCLLATCISLE